MSQRGWVATAVGVVVALAAVVVLVAIVLFVAGGDDEPAAQPSGPIAAALRDAEPAGEPFTDLTATQVRVGGRTMDVVLADESDERFQGLRTRDDIGPYDGMLFVFDAPTSTSFTMSTVPVALQIGFYDANGRLVDRLVMDPCDDVQSRCPLYSADGPFTYALETLEGDLPEGDLSS